MPQASRFSQRGAETLFPRHGGLGLGDDVRGVEPEVVCETCPVPVERVGVEDVFGKSGPAAELLELYGLNAANIVAKAKAAVARK